MFRQLPHTFFGFALLLSSSAAPAPSSAQVNGGTAKAAAESRARDREIAARFAPVFFQALGDRRRGNFITNFDFDGDWRGDNNWSHAEVQAHRLRAFVYYAVSETPTHFLVHYAVFHPRDYKGGSLRGALLSQAIKEGVRRGGKFDPTGLSESAVLAHENDMEGCLVVAAKGGGGDLAGAAVVFVETLAHDRFMKYVPAGSPRAGFQTVRVDGQRPALYVEAKGHGVYAYDERDPKHAPGSGVLRCEYVARADDPEGHGATAKNLVGYDLVSIHDTLWPRARRSPNPTFGAKYDYGTRSVSVAQAAGRPLTRRFKLGELGAAFAGGVGAANAARPPWAWFDREERAQPLGEWFFDPASVVKRHFGLGDDFALAYLHHPFLGVRRKGK
ncbi:MAG TPA: hypothetical protein VF064_00830 [Pyrinomonadaceae bacterium]